MSEKINSVKLTDNDSGITYELDFNRNSVRFAENRGFKLDNVTDFPITGISDLFFYAFRMHHKNVTRDFTDKLIERMNGLTTKFIARLMNLYQQAATANNIRDDDDEEPDPEKKAVVTLEM